MSSEGAKRRLRLEMRALRRRMTPPRRAAAGEAVAGHVLASPELRPGCRVVLYLALPNEVPTDGLLRALLQRGHSVLLPRAREGDRLEFAPCREPEALVAGRFGVLEPPPVASATSLSPEDLVLVPGVAFDRQGGRLGRGGGWYDRSLPAYLDSLFGIAFHAQLVPSVPMEEWDRPVRGVFTERGLVRCDRIDPG